MEWISVNDGLPEDGQLCIITYFNHFVQGNRTTIARYADDDWHMSDGRIWDLDVKYWMEFPKPKED